MRRYIFIAWSNGPHLLAQLFHSRDAQNGTPTKHEIGDSLNRWLI